MSSYEKHNVVDFSQEQLEASIQSDFGINLQIKSKVIGGTSNQVYAAESSEGEIFIRMSKNVHTFSIEIAGYKLLKDNKIPVPNTLGYQETPAHIGIPTMIIEKAKGAELYAVTSNNPKLSEQLYKKAGELLKKIHDIKVQGFGELVLEDGKIKGKSPSWKEYLQNLNTIERYNYLIDHKLITDQEYAALLQNFDYLLNIKLPESSYIHNDFVAGHLFTDGKEITGIIDLGAAFAGDPKYDIARAYLNMSEDEKNYLAKGYEISPDDETVQKYLLYISARMIPWRHKHNFVDDRVIGYKHPLQAVKSILINLNKD